MARTTRARNSKEATVRQDLPNRNRGQRKKIALNGDGAAERRIFIWFAHPFPEKKARSVVTATLRLKIAGGDWTGTNTITARRVTQKWDEREVNWANQPNTTATSASTAVVTNGSDGDTVDIDISGIMSDVVAGNDWYGIRLTVDTTGNKRFWSGEADADFQPVMIVTWSKKPEEPIDPHPASGVVGTDLPTLGWSLRDEEQEDAQSDSQVIVYNDNAGDPGTVHQDSGEVANVEQEWTMTTPLVDGSHYHFKVRVKVDGIWSNYSDTVRFRYLAKGTLVITDPGATTDDLTPQISHTFTPSAGGGAQKAVSYLLHVKDLDDDDPKWEEVYRRSRKVSTDTTFTIPRRNVTCRGNKLYRIRVRVWDSADRTGIPGSPPYVQAEQEFTYERAAGVTPIPSGLTRITSYEGPGVRLEWQSATAPDYFALYIKDPGATNYCFKRDRLEPSEAFVSGTTYRYTFYEIPPGTWDFGLESVKLTSGKLKHSVPAELLNETVTVEGIWIVAPEKGIEVCLRGTNFDAAIGDDGEVFYPVNRRDPVRIQSRSRGYEGRVGGRLVAVGNASPREFRNRLERIKGMATGRNEIRIITMHYNFEVLLGNVQVPPAGDVPSESYEAEVEYWQVDDFTFRSRA